MIWKWRLPNAVSVWLEPADALLAVETIVAHSLMFVDALLVCCTQCTVFALRFLVIILLPRPYANVCVRRLNKELKL